MRCTGGLAAERMEGGRCMGEEAADEGSRLETEQRPRRGHGPSLPTLEKHSPLPLARRRQILRSPPSPARRGRPLVAATRASPGPPAALRRQPLVTATTASPSSPPARQKPLVVATTASPGPPPALQQTRPPRKASPYGHRRPWWGNCPQLYRVHSRLTRPRTVQGLCGLRSGLLVRAGVASFF